MFVKACFNPDCFECCSCEHCLFDCTSIVNCCGSCLKNCDTSAGNCETGCWNWCDHLYRHGCFDRIRVKLFFDDSDIYALKAEYMVPSCLCCLKEATRMTALDSNKEIGIGSVARVCCRMPCDPIWFQLQDATGIVQMQVNLNRKVCGLIKCDSTFNVYAPNGAQMATIEPMTTCWTRCCPCMFPIREFVLTFPINLEPDLKALLISACVYLVWL